MSVQHYGEPGYRSACGMSMQNLTSEKSDVTCYRCKGTQKFDPSKIRPSGYTAGAWRERRAKERGE